MGSCGLVRVAGLLWVLGLVWVGGLALVGVWARLGWRARVSEGECNKEPIGCLHRGFGPSGDQQPPL